MDAATTPSLVRRDTGYWGFNQSHLRGHRYERNRPIGRVRNAKPAHARKVDPDETTRA